MSPQSFRSCFWELHMQISILYFCSPKEARQEKISNRLVQSFTYGAHAHTHTHAHAHTHRAGNVHRVLFSFVFVYIGATCAHGCLALLLCPLPLELYRAPCRTGLPTLVYLTQSGQSLKHSLLSPWKWHLFWIQGPHLLWVSHSVIRAWLHAVSWSLLPSVTPGKQTPNNIPRGDGREWTLTNSTLAQIISQAMEGL